MDAPFVLCEVVLKDYVFCYANMLLCPYSNPS
jgi:hypothetical protein